MRSVEKEEGEIGSEGNGRNENTTLKVTWWNDVTSCTKKMDTDSPGVIQFLSNTFSVGRF